MAETFRMSRTMLQGSAVTCSQEFLGRTLDLFNSCDFVLNVHERLESSSSSSSSSSFQSAGKSSLPPPPNSTTSSGLPPIVISSSNSSSTGAGSSSASFSRDGILMSTETTLGPLLKHVFKEAQRRDGDARGQSASASSKASSAEPRAFAAAGGAGGGALLRETESADLEEFVAILQKSENYILAIRALLSSRCRYFDKSKVIQ